MSLDEEGARQQTGITRHPMDIQEASNLAKELMARHGLLHWSFKLNKTKRQLGVCKEYAHRIELSEHYVSRNSREHVLDTVLHEIAHALVGTKHGHDAVWKEMCLQLGCTPTAFEKSANMPEGDWTAKCPSCRKIFTQHRRPKHLHGGLYCIKCGPEDGALNFSNVRHIYEKKIEKAERAQAVQLMLKLF